MRMLVAIFLLVAAVVADSPPVVKTTGGQVMGYTSTSRSGRKYFSFSGIRFARPPLGQLRFQPPQEPEPWSGVSNATQDGPFCIQYNVNNLKREVIGEEDCLHLSLHTHDIRGNAPVMFHIHGGGFISGDKSKTGPQYLMDEDVVTVDINYRIGIMGFLSFEDTVMPGNQGLKDQNMALRWVVNNIAKFGGDPSRVTLVGESAGGASVTHHTISAMSKGLFQGGIAESGSSYNILSLLPPGLAKSRASRLAKLLSCPQENSKAAVYCLQEKDANELVSHLEDFIEWQVDPFLLFQPVLEPEAPGAFLIGPISSWEPSPVPLLIGTNAADGLQRTKFFLYYGMDFKWYNDNFEQLAPLSFRYFATASNTEKVTKMIRDFYFGNREITKDDWINITTAYTDALYTNGIFNTADKHTGDVYFYYFDYLGEYTFGPQNRSFVFGASHIDEVIYLWQSKNFAPLKGEDLEFSKNMVKIWTDFAKYGKAITPDGKEKWEKWTSKIHNFLHISNSGFKVDKGLHEDRYQFWKNLNYRDLY